MQQRFKYYTFKWNRVIEKRKTTVKARLERFCSSLKSILIMPERWQPYLNFWLKKQQSRDRNSFYLMRCWIYTPSLGEQWKFYVKYWQVCSGRRLTGVLWVSQPSSSGNSWWSGHCISGWEPGWRGQQDCLQHLVPWLHTICFQQAKYVALPVWALTGVCLSFIRAGLADMRLQTLPWNSP